MAFAQINYSQKLGSGTYSIAAAGCFLTAFCNLLARYGESIDPPTLNNFFNSHDIYTHDSSEGAGTKDDLYWGSVSAYDGHIIPVGVGGAGWPPTNDAIVKFIYKSPRTGAIVTHFCLVADHSAGTIVDSWDGNTKKSPYGTPVAWAIYERHLPQVVTPPPPAETPAFTIENIPERTEELKVNAHLWDLNQRTWPGLVNNPVGSGGAGTKFQTSQIAHHIMGGSYYLPAGSTTQGYNAVDCEVPAPDPAPAPPAPAPTPPPPPAPSGPKLFTTNVIDGVTFDTIDGAPKQMWVNRVGGAEKWSFKDVTNWRGFKSVQHLDYGTEVFISGAAHHPIPPTGAEYLMTNNDFGSFKTTGQVANFYGFNLADLTDKKPPVLPAAATSPTTQVTATNTGTPVKTSLTSAINTPPVDSTTPVPWQKTYRPFPKAIHYISTRDITVKDLSGQQPDMLLPKYDPGADNEVGVVSAWGTLTYEGADYYRLKTNNDPSFSFYYSVPKIDPVTKTPLLLVMPTNPLEPVSKVSVARDSLQLAKSRIEQETLQFIDILPKWLRAKK